MFVNFGFYFVILHPNCEVYPIINRITAYKKEK